MLASVSVVTVVEGKLGLASCSSPPVLSPAYSEASLGFDVSATTDWLDVAAAIVRASPHDAAPLAMSRGPADSGRAHCGSRWGRGDEGLGGVHAEAIAEAREGGGRAHHDGAGLRRRHA